MQAVFNLELPEALASLRHSLKKTSNSSPVLLQIYGEAGVGRSHFLATTVIKELPAGSQVSSFSCLEGPLLFQLARALSADIQAVEFSSLSGLLQAWVDHIRACPAREIPVLIFENLQDLEGSELKPFRHLIHGLLKLDSPLLILLEYASDTVRFEFSDTNCYEEALMLQPWSKSNVDSWIRAKFFLELNEAQLNALIERSQGIIKKLQHWVSLLKSQDLLQTLPNNWPEELTELVQKQLSQLPSYSLELFRCLSLHTSWVSDELLAQASGVLTQEVVAFRESLAENDWVLRSKEDSTRWVLTFELIAEQAMGNLAGVNNLLIHQRYYRFLKHQNEWPFLYNWLAFHSAEANDQVDAFCWNTLVGQVYANQDAGEIALAYYGRAHDFAQTPFKQSYLYLLIGNLLLRQENYEQALLSIQRSYQIAEKIDWEDFIQDSALLLARVFSHLGKYSESESYLDKALLVLKKRGFNELWWQERLQLGVVELEQAKYVEAMQIFRESIADDIVDVSSSFGVQLNMLQVYIALGQSEQAQALLSELREKIKRQSHETWTPFLDLLLAKFYFTQGQLAQAIRVLEGAAHDFEKMGDIDGKVEVLLAMSAPLLEYNLIKEAQAIIDLLADWEGLERIPALQHSIHLRRLAIGAFSGTWVADDLELASQGTLSIGRTEDWLQFWFHLALAGKKRGNKKYFKQFLTRAQNIAMQIAESLPNSMRESFLQRPDIARIGRLMQGQTQEQSITARRDGEQLDAVDAASLAPPTRGNNLKKD